jgi:hypothetical protein
VVRSLTKSGGPSIVFFLLELPRELKYTLPKMKSESASCEEADGEAPEGVCHIEEEARRDHHHNMFKLFTKKSQNGWSDLLMRRRQQVQ